MVGLIGRNTEKNDNYSNLKWSLLLILLVLFSLKILIYFFQIFYINKQKCHNFSRTRAAIRPRLTRSARTSRRQDRRGRIGAEATFNWRRTSTGQLRILSSERPSKARSGSRLLANIALKSEHYTPSSGLLIKAELCFWELPPSFVNLKTGFATQTFFLSSFWIFKLPLIPYLFCIPVHGLNVFLTLSASLVLA